MVDDFCRHPIIKAVNMDAVSLTFEVNIDGKTFYVCVENIPENYPPSTCWIFDDKEKLKEILKNLEEGGWEIVKNEIN